MKEILLAKYGELVLKGLNRSYFEGFLEREIKRRLKGIEEGAFSVKRSQSTVYVEQINGGNDLIEDAFDELKKVFGIAAVCRAAQCEKDIEIIKKTAIEYVPQFMDGYRSFKCEAKRSDKAFPMTSIQISSAVGGELSEAMPHIAVDVNHPDVVVKIEIREHGAFIHAGQFKGAGGMPCGSNGKGLLLLSGGIDSPVAGYMLAKRGVTIEALHFESFPYTSERAREKVFDLAKKLSEYTCRIKVHVISLTKIQEALRDNCDEEYFTLLLRRYMMRLAQRTAQKRGCGALITGESLGQVASQTMQALGVTDNAVDMPVFRPCIGMDKDEIVEISRKIDTFETSIQPYEDCCTVFTPRHPKTKPDLEKVLVQENKLDFKALEDEAFETLTTVEFRYC